MNIFFTMTFSYTQTEVKTFPAWLFPVTKMKNWVFFCTQFLIYNHTTKSILFNFDYEC